MGDGRRSYSAALCRGLIEALAAGGRVARQDRRILRLYAAASLKRDAGASDAGARDRYSAALCRGLIEASRPTGR